MAFWILMSAGGLACDRRGFPVATPPVATENAILATRDRAMAAHESDRRDQALPHFREVKSLDPEWVSASSLGARFFLAFAECLSREGSDLAAIDLLTQVSARFREPALLDRLGELYLDVGKPSDAQRVWEVSAATDPTRAEPWLQLGRASLRVGDYEHAARRLEQARQRRPSSYEVLSALATAEHLRGHTADANRLRVETAEARRRLPPSETGMGSMPRPKTPGHRG